jgi:hypothetical protein
MKKLFIILAIICLFAAPVAAQTWQTANQVTIAWDPVAKIQPTDTIKYQVYMRQDLVSNGTAIGAPVETAQAVVTFSTEGRYYLGVETLRFVSGETEPVRSATKAWSNDAAACGPAGPFGVKYFVLPGAAKGLRLQ